jgi:hypothetical protein
MSSPPSSHHEKHDEKHLEDVNLEANRDGFDGAREKELM